MKRIYLCPEIIIRNNWNRMHGLPMRRRVHLDSRIALAKRKETKENGNFISFFKSEKEKTYDLK